MFSRKQFNSGKGNRVSASLIARKLTNRFHEKSVRLALIARCVTSFFSFLSFEKTWNFESLSNFKGFTESVNVRFLFDVTFILAPNFSSRMMKTRTIFLHTSESIATTIHRTIIRITPLYIPREFSKEDSPRFPLFHGSTILTSLIAAVRLSPPCRLVGEEERSCTSESARRYREISRRVVTRLGNELLVTVHRNRKGRSPRRKLASIGR